MKVVEIFKSIEGEGIRSGYLCTFIRLYGCNLSCSYCDSRYACEEDNYKELDIKEIVEEVIKLKTKRITITGGEPLMHTGIVSLIKVLLNLGYELNVETNGSRDVSVVRSMVMESGGYIFYDNLFFTVDYKLYDSGMNEYMRDLNFIGGDKHDVYKFVVSSYNDLVEMNTIIKKYNINNTIFVSPVFGLIEPEEIVDFLKDNDIENVRLQLQIHKIIWDKDTRGV